MSGLERRYRRLLKYYPREHRERTSEEMLGVLMAAAGDRERPGFRDSADLLWGAFRLHLRRILGAGVEPRDVLAIVSLLGPVLMLAGATRGLHELAWWIKRDALSDMSFRQFPDASVWVGWLVVAVLVLFGMRRAAAVGAWLATAGFVLLIVNNYWWTSQEAGFVLLGAVTAAALTWSPGPARGRELAGRGAVVIVALTVIVTMAIGVVGYRSDVSVGAGMAVLVCGALLAAGIGSRVGRHAALILSLPVIAELLLMAFPGRIPLWAELVVFYGVPLGLLVASGGLPRRIGSRPDTT